MPFWTVEDACPYNGGRVAEDVDPYKIILNIFMRSSLWGDFCFQELFSFLRRTSRRVLPRATKDSLRISRSSGSSPA